MPSTTKGKSSEAMADPLLHEWLQVEDTEFKRRFALHKGKRIQKPWVLDWSYLRKYGFGAEFEGYLTPPWRKLFTFDPTYYPQLALEFVSSFVLHYADIPYNHRNSGVVRFRLGGRTHYMSLRQFAVCTGLYEEEDVVSDEFLNAFTIEKPDREYTTKKKELWARIARPGYQAYRPSHLKTSYIVNPAHRLLHKCICKTMVPRNQSNALCTNTDFFYMHCLTDRVPCNLALSLARLFHSYGTNSHPSVVFGAVIVRNIANALHISLDGLIEMRDFAKWDKTWLISNDVIESKTTGVHEVEAAVKDLENNVPKNSHYLETSQDYRKPEYCQNPQVFPNLNQVPITKNIQTSQNTQKDAPAEVGVQIKCETTCSREYEVGNEYIGGNIKRSRTSEEGDYSVHSDPETPNSGGSAIHLAVGKDAFGNKGKGNVSQSSWSFNEIAAELRAMRVTRDHEVELMKQRVELMKKRLEFEQIRELKKEERNTKKAYYMHLNTLFAKEHLSPEDEDVKCRLVAMLYGK